MTNTKDTVLDVLGKVSGIKRSEMDEILQKVRANRKDLESCTYHNFVGIPGQEHGTCKDGTVIYRRFRCANCRGEADSHAVHWYNDGLRHGKAPR